MAKWKFVLVLACSVAIVLVAAILAVTIYLGGNGRGPEIMEAFPKQQIEANTPRLDKVDFAELEEVRVFLKFTQYDETYPVRRQINARRVGDDEDFPSVLKEQRSHFQQTVPVIIDAEPQVPWQHVVDVIAACRDQGLQFQFAAPRW